MTPSPAPDPFLPARASPATFRIWTWAAVLACLVVCVAMTWLHYEQRQTISRTAQVLEDVREARIDLAKGFLHVLLGSDQPSPFHREEGMALLDQAIQVLERADRRGVQSPGLPAEAAETEVGEFGRMVHEFRASLIDWLAREEGSRRDLELRLRIDFHELERLAGRIDTASQAELEALRSRLDRRFGLTLTASVVLLAAVCAGVYVNARSQAEAFFALRRSEKRFRQLAETIQEVFWVTDAAKTRMLYVSPAYETIWGRSRQRLRDEPRSWMEFVHPEDRERVTQAALDRQIDGSYAEEFRILRPDGQVRWIRDRAFPVRGATGTVERIVGVARDVTEQKQAEEELARRGEQLRQSQKMEAIGQLAGGVAHDFNNLLSTMMLQIDLLASGDSPPAEVREGLGEIRGVAERAANLTRQLLLFSRRQVMQHRDVDLNEVVANIAKLLRRVLGEHIALNLDFHPTPLLARADAGMLDQVLLNLAVNARDAMPDGGQIWLATAAKTVDEEFARLHADAVPGIFVCLSVRDSGSGIAPEVLPRIFEPFFTTKELGKGTGLGLATVFGIVRQHGGFITVESAPGKGSCFEVYFPANAQTRQGGPRPEAVSAPALPGGSETVLVVEDETALRTLTRATLERHGYRVLEAADGEQALQIWAQHAGQVALLLTDLVMPGALHGREVARRLRLERAGLRVVFTSGYSPEIAGREPELRPGSLFLSKPFTPDQLLSCVRQCLDG